MPDEVLQHVLDHLDAPSRRSYRSTDRHALCQEDAQRRADRLLAASRWAGSAAGLSDVACQLAELPATYRPRLLDAVATRIQAVGHAAMPALRAVIRQLLALPCAFRQIPAAATSLVRREFARSIIARRACDPEMEECDAALAAASPGAPCPAEPGPETPALDVGEEARLQQEEVVAFSNGMERPDRDAGAWLADWYVRVGALMPPSARIVPLKASAIALRSIKDANAWSAFGRAIAPLAAQARADVLGELLQACHVVVHFDFVLGLVGELPPCYRDTLLADLSLHVMDASREVQVARIQALSELAGPETGMVCTRTALYMVMVMDSLDSSAQQLIRQYADKVLERLTLSGKAAMIAEAASQRTMASRLWALSKLPDLAQAQAAHAVPAEPGVDATIPYRAEVVRRMIVGMIGWANVPSPFQLVQVWPALCEALQNIEEGGREFALAALSELARDLPQPQRAQAFAIAYARTAPAAPGEGAPGVAPNGPRQPRGLL